jgi:predicted nuclease of restriction endonuclease-like (RecB) superfamily
MHKSLANHRQDKSDEKNRMNTPTGKSTLALPEGYADWLALLKGQIVQARQRASLSVNAELVQLYARVGRDILERQQTQGWGAKVIDRLALDLKDAFADMRGWSSRNLKYMRFFAQHCPDGVFGQQPAAQLPWFHIVTVLTQVSDAAEREWYAVQTVQQGWSRTTLSLNIKNRLHLRQGAAVTNFKARLPAPDSALAHDTLKDPYLFDFLGLGDDAHEREIESGLLLCKAAKPAGGGVRTVGHRQAHRRGQIPVAARPAAPARAKPAQHCGY